MKVIGGSTDLPTGPRRNLESYGYRRQGLTFAAELPADTECYLEIDEKRDAMIVRRRFDKAIVMVVKRDQVILKPV